MILNDSLDTVELVMAFEGHGSKFLTVGKNSTVGDAIKFIESKSSQQTLLYGSCLEISWYFIFSFRRR